MRRTAFIIIILLVIISACSQVATPIPFPTETATVTASITISIEDITAAATYIRTLPPSFTPTFTPSITPTPTQTYTPTATFTATVIPESALCEQFLVGQASIDEPLSMDDLNDFIEAYIPIDGYRIYVEITNLNTGEIVETHELGANEVWILSFTPLNFPEIADYEWVMTLEDATRTGMCETSGTFDTRIDEFDVITQTAIARSTLSVEVIPEATAEATSEITVPERPTGTPSATGSVFSFPPR